MRCSNAILSSSSVSTCPRATCCKHGSQLLYCNFYGEIHIMLSWSVKFRDCIGLWQSMPLWSSKCTAQVCRIPTHAVTADDTSLVLAFWVCWTKATAQFWYMHRQMARIALHELCWCCNKSYLSARVLLGQAAAGSNRAVCFTQACVISHNS